MSDDDYVTPPARETHKLYVTNFACNCLQAEIERLREQVKQLQHEMHMLMELGKNDREKLAVAEEAIEYAMGPTKDLKAPKLREALTKIRGGK